MWQVCWRTPSRRSDSKVSIPLKHPNRPITLPRVHSRRCGKLECLLGSCFLHASFCHRFNHRANDLIPEWSSPSSTHLIAGDIFYLFIDSFFLVWPMKVNVFASLVRFVWVQLTEGRTVRDTYRSRYQPTKKKTSLRSENLLEKQKNLWRGRSEVSADGMLGLENGRWSGGHGNITRCKAERNVSSHIESVRCENQHDVLKNIRQQDVRWNVNWPNDAPRSFAHQNKSVHLKSHGIESLLFSLSSLPFHISVFMYLYLVNSV